MIKIFLNYIALYAIIICENCRNAEGLLRMKSLNINDENRNNNLVGLPEIISNNNLHNHKLIYCRTSRSVLFCYWICKKCNCVYDSDTWSYYCTLCDHDICSNCSS